MPDLANVGVQTSRPTVVSGGANGGLGSAFQMPGFSFALVHIPAPDISFGASQTATSTVTLVFSTVLASVDTTATKYTIAGTGTITVSSVAWTPGTAVVTLTVTGTFVANTIYVVSIQTGAVLDSAGHTTSTTPSFVGLNFSGGGGGGGGDTVPPVIYALVPITATTVKVIYSEPVVAAEALVVGNYSVNNGLVVLGVTQIDAQNYLLRTTSMTSGTIYTVTVSGVHDLSGNLI